MGAGGRGEVKFNPDLPDVKDGEVWLTVSFQEKGITPWAPSGHEVAWFQHPLKSLPMSLRSFPKAPIEFESTRSAYTIYGSGFSLSLSRSTGNLTSWVVNNYQLLDPGTKAEMAISPGFWRPPTDNDMPRALGEWRRYGLDHIRTHLRKMSLSRINTTNLKVVSEAWLAPPTLAWGFLATITYTITGDGSFTVSVRLDPKGAMPADLPRMGLDLRLVDALDNAKWFGLGPGESYPDKKCSQKHGIYKATTEQLHTPYEVPQEGGNRCETRWLKLIDNRGWGIEVVRNSLQTVKDRSDCFQWSASRYSAEEIEAAKHPCDLVPGKTVLVRIDAETSGVGTGACGPSTLPKYLVGCEKREFQFTFVPCFGN